MSGWKWRSLDSLVLLLLVALGTFASVRARHEFRWSYWAFGDAQVLNAAIHFRDEGFIKNNFLMFPSPGYVHPLIPHNWPNGRYTHYPPFHVWVAGVCAKIFGHPHSTRYCAILVSVLSILFWYLFARKLFGRGIALWSAVFMAGSVIFLDFIDCLGNQPYDFFFRSCGLFLIVKAADDGTSERPWVKRWAGIALWSVLFFEMSNSFEYAIHLEIFLVGYYFIRGKLKSSLKEIIIFTSAPLFAFLLHFLQAALEWGSVKDACADLLQIFFARFSGYEAAMQKQEINIVQWGMAFKNFFVWVGTFYWFYYKWALMVLLASFLIRVRRGIDLKNLHHETILRIKLLLLLAICGVSFWILLPDQSYRMGSYIPIHAFPVLALLFAMNIALFTEDLKSIFFEPVPRGKKILLLSFYAAGIVLTLFPLNWTAAYLRHYPHLMDRELWGIRRKTLEEWKDRVEQGKMIGENTKWGDIILVPEDSGGHYPLEGNPIEEFYAQRKYVPMGKNFGELLRKITALKRYQAGYSFKEPGISRMNFYIWIDSGRISPDTVTSVKKQFVCKTISPGRFYLCSVP